MVKDKVSFLCHKLNCTNNCKCNCKYNGCFQTLPLSITSYRYFDWPSYRCSSISSQSGGVTGNEAVLIILVITALLETINQGKEQSSVIFTITSSESQKHLLQHYYSN